MVCGANDDGYEHDQSGQRQVFEEEPNGIAPLDFCGRLRVKNAAVCIRGLATHAAKDTQANVVRQEWNGEVGRRWRAGGPRIASPQKSTVFEIMRGRLRLKNGGEFREGIEFQQMLAFGGRLKSGVLKDPLVFVKEEDGVKACGERWIDIALDAVADHPTCGRSELMPGDDFAISGRILFEDDFDGGKMGSES